MTVRWEGSAGAWVTMFFCVFSRLCVRTNIRREMHRNIGQQIFATQMNYLCNYDLRKRSCKNCVYHGELSNAHASNFNVYNRITNIFHRKRKCGYSRGNLYFSVARKTQQLREQILFQLTGQELSSSLAMVCFALAWKAAQQLLSISLTSSMFNSEVRCYLLLENAHQKFLAETTTCMEEDLFDLDPFYAWGMLLKASTIVMDSRERRSFLSSFFFKFCEKWDFHECEALMYMVLCFTELNQLMYKVLFDEVGKYPSLEMEIRMRLRGLFLSHSTKDERDYGFWISAILRTQQTTKLQGKLFMIMFGPIKITEYGCGESFDDFDKIMKSPVLCDGSIDLQHMCARLLGSIALGFYHLSNTSTLGYYAWSDDQLFILMEEISMLPKTWMFDNFASLLALRPQIIHIALFTLLLEGRMDEAAHVFHGVKAVLHRWGVFVSGAVSDVMLKIFRALPATNRRLFLSSLLKTESYQLSGLLLDAPCRRYLRESYLMTV
uniref:FBXO47 ARM repeats region domain-containing protein n=1 Tax=Setaria digitata TaxID=48799 RepID=A0A915PVS3_9BILA